MIKHDKHRNNLDRIIITDDLYVLKCLRCHSGAVFRPVVSPLEGVGFELFGDLTVKFKCLRGLLERFLHTV